MKTVNNPRGKALTCIDQTLVFAPLSLGAVERFEPLLAQFNTGGGKVGDVIDMAHASLKRNYPDITREEVAEFIDTDNSQEVFSLIMGVSGYTSKTEAGQTDQGE